jgi:hypothetical protein
MIPQTSARINDDTMPVQRGPAQVTTQRGPGAVSSISHDNRTELDRIAAQRDSEIRDPDADVPKVEPVPEVPGLFIFTTPVMSSKAGTKIDRVTLRPATARTLIQNGAFMKTTRRTFRDEATRTMVTEESTAVDFGILAKHVSDMSGLAVVEVESISAYDMMRMSLKIQEMLYTLPPS